LDSYTKIQDQSPNTLLNAVANQPVAVSIDASGIAFSLYTSGVINLGCGTSLNHAVLVVGYGHDDKQNLDYWLIKNSWGAGWGESGYFRVRRDMNTVGPGTCGLQVRPVYPTL